MESPKVIPLWKFKSSLRVQLFHYCKPMTANTDNKLESTLECSNTDAWTETTQVKFMTSSENWASFFLIFTPSKTTDMNSDIGCDL